MEFDFAAKEPILKGWSADKKYRVTTKEGACYLLKISPLERLERRRAQFKNRKRLENLNLPLCYAIECGVCEEGVYTLETWIEGEEAEAKIPLCSDTQQYVYGLRAGEILREIHSLSPPEAAEDWHLRFGRKVQRKIEGYWACPLKYEEDGFFFTAIEENRELLRDRPQSYQHGDYHLGNMLIDPTGNLYVIDFDRDDCGDPWEEFNRIPWCVQQSPLFASGMVNGYFQGEVPPEFWRLLALYISSNILSSLYWAIPFGEQEVETMRRQAREILEWYRGHQNYIPSWYFPGYYLQEIDGCPYKLKSPYDFGFLKEYGKVFQVFDDQDSGNICFGVAQEGEKYFLKFAGAPTEQYEGSPKEAVERLKATLPVYQALRHPNLIEFLGSQEIGGGFLLKFRWAEGACMGRMYPAARERFLHTSLEARKKIFADILSFFEYLAREGFEAIDFYDGSVLYDFASGKTTICDIDFFRKKPCVNDMGRMWGSSHFQSPEEYVWGAVLDEVTNVYTLGATAFALFSNYNREEAAWPLSRETYRVVSRAVSDNRAERQQSISQFRRAWELALIKTEP